MMDDLLITDRHEAAHILRSAERGPRVRHLLSIGDPGQDPPPGYLDHPSRKLYLQFHDIDVVPGGPWANLFRAPTMQDVEAILRFGEEIQGGLLIHCQAGISRSTAAAAVLVAARLGPGRELEAAELIRRVRPIAWPNRLLVAHGDDVLGLEGRLSAAIQEVCYDRP